MEELAGKIPARKRKLLRKIDESQFGYHQALQGPYGPRRSKSYAAKSTKKSVFRDAILDPDLIIFLYQQWCTLITLHLEDL